MTENEKVYIVGNESTGERWVFTDREEAREANSVGHWKGRFLRPATLNPDEEEWRADT